MTALKLIGYSFLLAIVVGFCFFTVGVMMPDKPHQIPPCCDRYVPPLSDNYPP
jgi:hypothetical protein